MDPDAKKRRLEALMGGAGASSGFGLAGAAGAPPPAVAGPSSAVEPLAREAFQVSANEALSFRLVRTAAELDSSPSFSPDFTHQVFREDETIWGYKDLQVRVAAPGGCPLSQPCASPVLKRALPQIVISLHALSFHALVEVSHSGTAPSALGPPDNVLARLKEAFPAGIATDRAAFLASLLELGPTPPLPGGATQVEVAAPPCVGLRVVHLALTTADACAWHARLAPLVLFFIDAGTHLETECAPVRPRARPGRLTRPACALVRALGGSRAPHTQGRHALGAACGPAARGWRRRGGGRLRDAVPLLRLPGPQAAAAVAGAGGAADAAQGCGGRAAGRGARAGWGGGRGGLHCGGPDR
jgi:histone acetyltransferase 1